MEINYLEINFLIYFQVNFFFRWFGTGVHVYSVTFINYIIYFCAHSSETIHFHIKDIIHFWGHSFETIYFEINFLIYLQVKFFVHLARAFTSCEENPFQLSTQIFAEIKWPVIRCLSQVFSERLYVIESELQRLKSAHWRKKIQGIFSRNWRLSA